METSRAVRIAGGAVLVVALVLVATTSPAAASGSAGAAEALQQADGPDESVALDEIDGTTVWRGQTVEIIGFDADETVAFVHDDDDDAIERVATDGTVVLDTAGLAAGEWAVEPAVSNASATFSLQEQELTLGTLSWDWSAEVWRLYLADDRREYELGLQSDTLDGHQLDAVIGRDAVAVDDDRAVFEISDDNFVYAFLADAPTGNHTIRGTVTDTGVTSTDYLVADPAAGVEAAIEELDGRTVWTGQRLQLTGFEENETVDFVHETGTSERVATGGTVVVDTGGLATGEWTVERGVADTERSFVLRDQSLDARFAAERAVEETTVAVESNRSDYQIALESDDLGVDTLSSVFHQSETFGDRVVVDIDGSQERTRVDVSALPEGEHEIRVEAVATTASDTATLTVHRGVEVEGDRSLPHGDSDRLYDVNGDGSLTNADVVRFFDVQHYHPAVDAHPELFDFDGSGDVGQADVVELFETVTGEPIATRDSEFGTALHYGTLGNTSTIELDVENSDRAWIRLRELDHDYAVTVELADVGDEPVDVDVDALELARTRAGAAIGVDGATIVDVRQVGDEADDDPATRLPGRTEFHVESYSGDPAAFESEDFTRLVLDEPADAERT